MCAKPRIVAIDGPAGSGKSTVCKQLAARLGFVLLDTGALYRAVALAARLAGVDWNREAAVVAVADRLVTDGELRLDVDPEARQSAGGTKVVLGGHDVSSQIRKPEISMGASRVSAYGGVRDALLELQRQLGTPSGSDRAGVVAEGRDIGTVVFPDAPVKFFLTASLEVRAQRRQAELDQKGESIDFEQTLKEVALRDEQDRSRKVAPLKQAADARVVDSTGKTIDEVVAEMQRVVEDVLG
ncbi:MAG: (d)CMP kinase [Deltaproteobacteria bacterium]|nr:MAG: (d)CMP kinase [Deltaproteobacteria bacterium]